MSSHADKPRPEWAVDHEFSAAITKSETVPALEALPPYQRPTMQPGDPQRFSINTVAEPTSWQVKRIKVEMRGEFWSSLGVAGDGGQGEGGCDAFTCPVIIDSDEPEDKVAHLTEVCRKACMAFETVARAVPTSTTLVLNGEPHTIGAGQ